MRNNVDTEYFKILQELVDKSSSGVIKKDRTGVGTTSIFGRESRYNFDDGFPILTTKKVFFHGVKIELLWFLGNHLQLNKYKDLGRTNILYLIDNKTHIWDDWPFQYYLDKNGIKCEKYSHKWLHEKKEFIQHIQNDINFAYTWGSIGEGAYGQQWRDFDGVDQIHNIINLLKTDPDSRRMVVSAWSPSKLHKTLLPPCHYSFEFYSEEIDSVRYLSIKYNMRSVDYFLGSPFNISSYSLLLAMIAQVVGMVPKDVVTHLGNVHLYSNHIQQAKLQLERQIKYDLPTLKLNLDIQNIDDFQIDDIQLIDYQCDDYIKAPIAV